MEIKKSKDPWEILLKDPEFTALMETLIGSVGHNSSEKVLLITKFSERYDTIISQTIKHYFDEPNFEMDIPKRNKALLVLDRADQTGIEEDWALYIDAILWLIWCGSSGDILRALRYCFLVGREWDKER